MNIPWGVVEWDGLGNIGDVVKLLSYFEADIRFKWKLVLWDGLSK
jgi:hypothetical protein